MFFCYPKLSNTPLASVIATLACQPFLPVAPLELSRVVQLIADNSGPNRLNSNSSCVRIGSSVELRNLDTHQQGWLQLVYPQQASYRSGHISVLSPLGRALLGQTTETEIQLMVLGYQLRLRVLSVINVKQRMKRRT
ncbi:GreA/GreB family elongation factor [Rheinheimera sp. FR7-31]|uniref:GreA/GreB family elongation factor n=1 Tax=Rheinheimera fenheensis TaxID=3152295 RepID=UPI00325E9AE2